MEKIFKIILLYVPIIGLFTVLFGTHLYKNKQKDIINPLKNKTIFITSAISQSVFISYLIIKTII